jgi:GPH family glycoside/pentoside/hexuronide:cation symporter
LDGRSVLESDLVMNRNTPKSATSVLRVGRRVPRREVLAYGSMVASTNVMGSAGSLYTFVYITEVFGLDLRLFLLANFIFMFYNTFNDIAFGVYADRTRHRLGRRIPYLRYLSLFVVITPFIFWFPWPGTAPGDLANAQPMKFIQFLGALSINDTITTILSVSLGAWVPEATESEEGRTKLALVGTIGNLFGGLAVPFIPLIYFSGIDNFRYFMVLGGIIYALVWFGGSFVLKERPQLYQVTRSHAGVKEVFKSMFKLYRKKAVIGSIIWDLSLSFLLLIFMQYARLVGYAMGIDNAEIIVLAFFFVPCYLMFAVLARLVKKTAIDRTVGKVLKPCLAVLMILFTGMITLGLPILLLGSVAVSGITFSLGIYSGPILGNIIDNDELETNQRREALYGAARSLFLVPSGQIMAIIVSAALVVIGYNQIGGLAGQTSATLFSLGAMFFLLPMACCILALTGFRLYPFKKERLNELKDQVIKLHKKKETGRTTSRKNKKRIRNSN